jgi:hypothetical protein
MIKQKEDLLLILINKNFLNGSNKKEGLSSHGLPKRSPTLVLTMPNVA